MECSLIYILRNNKLYGMFAEYYTLQVLRSLNMFFLMMYGRDKSALRLRCVADILFITGFAELIIMTPPHFAEFL